uniref:Uncharacterized protein n=1 Tax=Rousettus aegyptiacus TaxID=9407 RepID=A0A7J8IME5_ROUAE|nr:hypothetical protein HJG63_010654 [Rousettus aegyptiacus]
MYARTPIRENQLVLPCPAVRRGTPNFKERYLGLFALQEQNCLWIYSLLVLQHGKEIYRVPISPRKKLRPRAGVSEKALSKALSSPEKPHPTLPYDCMWPWLTSTTWLLAPNGTVIQRCPRGGGSGIGSGRAPKCLAALIFMPHLV